MAKISSFTPTVCRLFGISNPKSNESKYLYHVIGAKSKIIGEEKMQKCLIYAPDALGSFLLEKYSEDFDRVKDIAPITADLEAVMKSYTPVCFASMFSGASPKTTGIEDYAKPVLKVETLFDALSNNNFKVALVSVKDCSIDIIFRDRKIQYYSEASDDDVTTKAIELIKNNDIDVVVCYNQDYDDNLHKTEPLSNECINSMYDHLNTFTKLSKVFHEAWSKFNRLICFTPDHGAHFDPHKGVGTHGTDMPEDLNVRHYFGIYKGE